MCCITDVSDLFIDGVCNYIFCDARRRSCSIFGACGSPRKSRRRCNRPNPIKGLVLFLCVLVLSSFLLSLADGNFEEASESEICRRRRNRCRRRFKRKKEEEKERFLKVAFSVKKEFFQLAIREILDPNYGMFVYR
jgi:hypothetical protein